MAEPLIVRRLSTPERIVRVPEKADEPPGATIAGFAFRYNVVREFIDAFNEQLALFSIVPTIENAAERLVKITFTTVHTGIGPGVFLGALIWREDGTDPISTEIPDDFERLDFNVADLLQSDP